MNIEDQQKIESVDSLPVKNRRMTDLFCAIFLSAYVVLLALILIFVHNQDNLNRMTYPHDTEGTLCGFEAPNYPYLYFTSLSDPTKRLCVNQCPNATTTLLSCKPTTNLSCAINSNPKYEVTAYNTYLDQGRIGLFCLPTDPYLKTHILELSHLNHKYEIYSVMDAFWTAAWVAAICGIVLFIASHFWPYKTVPWVIFIGGLFSILFSVFVLTLTAGFLLIKILLFLIFLCLGIISLRLVLSDNKRDSVVICSRLIHTAALTHSNKDFDHRVELSLQNFGRLLRPAALILAFIFVYFLFFYLNIKEVLSVWSAGKLVFVPDRPFYQVTGLGCHFLMILVGIQIVWGAFFIKESFNFIAASHAVNWYYSSNGDAAFLDSTELLLKYHWGSVAGGSLLQGFFYFIGLIFNIIYQSDENEEPEFDKVTKAVVPKKYKFSIDYDRVIDNTNNTPVKDFFDLIRGQALAYVSMVNLPYCNAARYCEYLSSNSCFYNNSQITNRILRINMHIVPIFIVLCIALGNMGHSATPYSILIITILTFFIITYFLSYHGQKTQGLLISLYVDEALNDGELLKAPKIMQKMYNDDVDYKHYDLSFKQLLFDSDRFNIE